MDLPLAGKTDTEMEPNRIRNQIGKTIYGCSTVVLYVGLDGMEISVWVEV